MNEVKIFCRDRHQQNLCNYLTEFGNETMPAHLFIYGNTATGKTFVLKEFLKARPALRSIFIDCIEYGTRKQLYESVIYGLSDNPDVKVESMHDFILQLNELDDQEPYVIVFDNAERLRDVEVNVLMTLLRLQEFTHLNITVIFISQTTLEKFYPRETGEEILQIFVPNYTKEEVALILSEDFKQNNSDEDLILFERYLTLFLNVFYKACRDLLELRFMANKYFKLYCQPIKEKTINRSDARKLWLNIAKPLKTGLSELYLRFNEGDGHDLQAPKTFELPLYDKYLLIAGFLASHNAPKDDQKLFVKNHGKQKKRAQQAHNVKVSEKTNLQLGPKSFTNERLWAIFESILGRKVDRTMIMETRSTTLIKLRLFRVVSGEHSILEGGRRLACNVSLDFIVALSQSIDFDLRPYLQFFTK